MSGSLTMRMRLAQSWPDEMELIMRPYSGGPPMWPTGTSGSVAMRWMDATTCAARYQKLLLRREPKEPKQTNKNEST